MSERLALQKILRALGNDVAALKSQRYFKTGKGEYGAGDHFLGICMPDIRQQVKLFRNMPLEQVVELLTSKWHEERLCAVLLLSEIFKRGNKPLQQEVYSLYLEHTDHINNWDIVDSSASQIVGAHLQERSRKPLYRLAKSNDLWQRRIAIIATFAFIRKADFSDTLVISELLLNDKEDLIHKAVGWMLREIGNRDRSTEVKFLKLHYNKMPRTMLRYAIEKFPENIRQDYLKGRIKLNTSR